MQNLTGTENRKTITIIDWCLRITVAVQCIGQAVGAVRDGTVINSLLFNTPETGGFGWQESTAALVDSTAGYALFIAAIFTLIRPCWFVLVPVSLWMLLIAVAGNILGGKLHLEELPPVWINPLIDHINLPAHATRILCPLALALWSPWPKKFLANTPKLFTINTLRIAAALTFFAHGVEALYVNSEFQDYLHSAGQQFLGWQVESSADEDAQPATSPFDTKPWEKPEEVEDYDLLTKTMLQWIGILDLVIAVILISRRWQAIAWWMVFWGVLTAFARIVHSGWPAYDQTLLRAANAGVPLAIALYWNMTKNIVATPTKPVDSKDNPNSTSQKPTEQPDDSKKPSTP